MPTLASMGLKWQVVVLSQQASLRRPRPEVAAGAADRFLSESTAIQFEPINPKKRGSEAYDRYEQYKWARTVGEALRRGAAKGDIKYDLEKGFARCTTAAPS